MGASAVFKHCTIFFLIFTLCKGDNYKENNEKNLEDTTEDAGNQVLQQSYEYDDNSAPRGVVIGVPIFSILVVICCIYYCCRCRTQTQGVVVGVRPAPPAAQSHTIIIQQQAPPPMQVQQPVQYVQQPVPYPQQHVPPPYDTQPYTQQQQFQQQPTMYANPNYAPQPPVNVDYGQPKY